MDGQFKVEFWTCSCKTQFAAGLWNHGAPVFYGDLLEESTE